VTASADEEKEADGDRGGDPIERIAPDDKSRSDVVFENGWW
jgi:hypothetical protein